MRGPHADIPRHESFQCCAEWNRRINNVSAKDSQLTARMLGLRHPHSANVNNCNMLRASPSISSCNYRSPIDFPQGTIVPTLPNVCPHPSPSIAVTVFASQNATQMRIGIRPQATECIFSPETKGHLWLFFDSFSVLSVENCRLRQVERGNSNQTIYRAAG
jgi:hypothetical protein